VINTALWDVGGTKGGVGGPGTGGGQWYNQEIAGPDGYLQARATTPQSGNTYGSDAWTMTQYNFNDGQDWVVTFTWEADIQSDTAFPWWPGATTPWHADYHLIEITDGRTDWSPGIYLHPPSAQLPGTVWLYETNGSEMGPVTWSILIDAQARTATLYEGPDGTGPIYSTATLDPSLPWHIRFITVVGTSLGFGAKDCRINLYDFSATVLSDAVEATVNIDPEVLNLGSVGKYITCYLTLPTGYDVSNVDPATILLNEQITPAWSMVDEEENVLTIKFDRSAVQELVHPGEVELMVIGALTDGTLFCGTDTILVIAPADP
jgi:hypothetical protein